MEMVFITQRLTIIYYLIIRSSHQRCVLLGKVHNQTTIFKLNAFDSIFNTSQIMIIYIVSIIIFSQGPFLTHFPVMDSNIPIKTMARQCTIIPAFIGKKFLVHNGRSYIPLTIVEQMVNHKLGEFAITKKVAVFKQKKEVQKKKK